MAAIIVWFFTIVIALFLLPVLLTLAVAFVGFLLLLCQRAYAGLRGLRSYVRPALVQNAASLTRDVSSRD